MVVERKREREKDAGKEKEMENHRPPSDTINGDHQLSLLLNVLSFCSEHKLIPTVAQPLQLK